MLQNWLRQLLGRNSSSPKKRQNGRPRRLAVVKLGLEMLEDRITPSGDAFAEPPVIMSDSVTHILTATLTEAESIAMVGDTSVYNAWTYNGSYVGPTLWAQPGDLLDLTILNKLFDLGEAPYEEPTNLHVHGLHVSPIGDADNVLLEIMPGGGNRYRIQIPADHPQGLYWYHPHHHGFVNDQISHGLSGLLVIGRPDGGAPQLDGFTQHLLGLKNALVKTSSILNAIATPPEGSDHSTQRFIVNGQDKPVLSIPAGRADVFNVANIGNDAFYTLAVMEKTGAGAYVQKPLLALAEDGNPFTNVNASPGVSQMKSLGMPPGRRWSFTFVPPTSPAKWYIVSMGFNFGDAGNIWPGTATDPLILMELNYTAGTAFPAPPAVGTPLTPPNQNYHDLRDIPDDQIAAHRKVTFQMGPNGEDMINGAQFPNNPVFQPRLNTVEEWTLKNETAEDHPFHLHTNPQQVVSSTFGKPNGLPLWQDVINVPPGQTVVIRIEFKDYLGELVYHCHRVGHEDNGMMALVKIIPEDPFYAVGANAGQTPLVYIFNRETDILKKAFFAYSPTYKGGVNVAVGDVNGDGVYDVITGKNQGTALVKVIDGTKLDQVDPKTGVILSSALLGSFYAFSISGKSKEANGVYVAAGDSSHDGLADIIVGEGQAMGKSPGTPMVKIVDATKMNEKSVKGEILNSALYYYFLAYKKTFKGGVRVAAGDFNGDGRIDVVTGQGPGGTQTVKMVSGNAQATIATFSYGIGHYGVYVAAGNIKGTAFDNIIVGEGFGGPPSFAVYAAADSMTPGLLNPVQIQPRPQVFAAPYKGGVKVTSVAEHLFADPFGNNPDDVVAFKATGPGGLTPKRFAFLG